MMRIKINYSLKKPYFRVSHIYDFKIGNETPFILVILNSLKSLEDNYTIK